MECDFHLIRLSCLCRMDECGSILRRSKEGASIKIGLRFIPEFPATAWILFSSPASVSGLKAGPLSIAPWYCTKEYFIFSLRTMEREIIQERRIRKVENVHAVEQDITLPARMD